MTLEQILKKITEAQAKAMQLYLRRQELEVEVQKLHQMRQQVEMLMMKSDGELDTLNLLKAELEAKPNG